MLNRIFGKDDIQDDASQVNNGAIVISTVFQERPRICLIDIADNIVELLKDLGFNCVDSTLGTQIIVPNSKTGDQCLCVLNYAIPANLHEYELVIVDLSGQETKLYDSGEHRQPLTKNASQFFFLVEFPQTVFDPGPLAGSIMSSSIRRIQKKESIIIVFASSLESVEYTPVEVTPRGPIPRDKSKYNNYSFLPNFAGGHNRIGVETVVRASGNEEFVEFLHKYNERFSYSAIFYHPTEWNAQERRSVKDENFIPLITNSAGEIVSYASFDERSIAFMFPQLKDKSDFLLDLLQVHLPQVLPSLFPYSTRFAWLGNTEYRLPKETELRDEKDLLQRELQEKISRIERAIEENQIEHQFLHNLLTETGDNLVKAVEHFLVWIGLDDVINCDEVFIGRNEEDLQVNLDSGLLIIEVKGIRGTSKDSDCAQIGKIKHRRCRERKAFDVFGLYIVNHQRYLPPEDRLNPPFTENQIQDALDDERGLLTTYDLFKLYFAVEAGYISREDVRTALLSYGLVTFHPSNAVLIGKPDEVHYGGHVGVFMLDDMALELDDELVAYQDGRFRTLKVTGLRDQDVDVKNASSGEIGIKLSGSISRNTELWKPS